MRPSFGCLFRSRLASTGTSSETVALEVVDSTLRVDTVGGEPRTWFALVFAAPTNRSIFETDKVILYPLVGIEPDLMPQGILGRVLLRFFFSLLLACDAILKTLHPHDRQREGRQ